MIYKTYLDKVNTIICPTKVNVGVSPVAMMVYGGEKSRILAHFDVSEARKRFEGRVTPDLSKCRHILNLTNCGKMDRDGDLFVEVINEVTYSDTMRRAASFTLLFFKLPCEFDSGNGYDFKRGFSNQQSISFNGATWFNCKTGVEWSRPMYTTEELSAEYDKFSRGEDSIIIARQKFDLGNESIRVDITDYVNSLILGNEPNNGIGIAFSPATESIELDNDYRFVAFYTHKTHTFFEPYLETIYDDVITDDRNQFYLNKKNRLYLYCSIGGGFENLDEMPTCKIDGIDSELEVKQAGKGIYYVELMLKEGEYKPKRMMYDVWGNLKYNGVEMPDVTMQFVLKPFNQFFNLSNITEVGNDYVVSVSGIKDNEVVGQSDLRKLTINARVEYSTNTQALLDGMELRLYVKDGPNEFDVISWDKVNKSFSENFYYFDTSKMIPHKYYVDVKVIANNTIKVFKDVLHFEIANNVTAMHR